MTKLSVLSPRGAKAHALALAVLANADSSATLDGLVLLAVARIGADGGQISMLTDRRVALCAQGVLSNQSPNGAELPYEDAMCTYALSTGDTVVIADAREDQRVAGIGAVSAGLVGAYLGVPIRTVDGSIVGVLCVFSQSPRTWTAAEQADMDELAAHVAVELERRLAADAVGTV